MRHTRKAFIVAAAIFAALVAGVAFAAWTTGGTGHGSAQAKTAVSLTTVGVPASTAGLYPGADAKVTVRAVNDNDFPVRISGVAYGSAAATTVSGALGSCVNGADAALCSRTRRVSRSTWARMPRPPSTSTGSTWARRPRPAARARRSPSR